MIYKKNLIIINNKFLKSTKIISNFKNFKYQKSIKFNKNLYIYLLFIFKYFIFENIVNNNIFFFNYLNQKYLYFNFTEIRFYYLLYYLLLKYNLFDFIELINKFIFKFEANNFSYDLQSPLIKKKKLEWWEEDTSIETYFLKKYFIFFFNNKIYIYIYLLKKNIKFILNFNKFDFYLYLNKFNTIYTYNEFKLKIDYKSFFLYKKYHEYFRLVKYNEYLANNKLLWNYPFLKILYTYKIKTIKMITTLRKYIILYSYNIYALNIFKQKKINKNIYFNNYIKFNSLLSIKNNQNIKNLFNITKKKEHNKNILLYMFKGYSDFNFKNFKLDNQNINLKILKLNIFNFIEFLQPITINLLFKIFKYIFIVYISYITYEIYHRYINLIRQWRKITWNHLLNIFWRLNINKFKFTSFFFKIFIKFKFKNIINNNILINYGFLSFYYLENNKILNKYLKKNILLYKIFNIIISKWYNYYIFDKLFKLNNKHPHKLSYLKNTISKKRWFYNYINENQLDNPKLAPLTYNIYTKTNTKNFQIFAFYNANTLEQKFKIWINFNYLNLWANFQNISIIKFFNIISLINNDIDLNLYFLNFKNSLEFILWEILNSNNKQYINYKNYLSFNFIIYKIKIDTLLSIFLTKYFNSIIYNILYYNKIYFNNCLFIYSFFSDFFLRIIYLKKKYIYNKNWISLFFRNLNILYKFKLNYNIFFFSQVNYYLLKKRLINYFNSYKNSYFKEYEFFFKDDYITKLKQVIKTLHFVNNNKNINYYFNDNEYLGNNNIKE